LLNSRLKSAEFLLTFRISSISSLTSGSLSFSVARENNAVAYLTDISPSFILLVQFNLFDKIFNHLLVLVIIGHLFPDNFLCNQKRKLGHLFFHFVDGQ